jgi:hypothetical protein
MTQANRVHSTPRRTASKNTQPANVVKLSDYRKPLPKRKKGESVYELYPLPFLNRKRRCMWDVTPTGAYTADCETGEAFGIEFLKTCDGTYGWVAFVRWVVLDMIRAGPETNGIIVGFMGVIGQALATKFRPDLGGGHAA